MTPLLSSEKIRVPIRWKFILFAGAPLVIIYLAVLAIDFQKATEANFEHIETYLQELVSHHAERVNGEFLALAQVAKTTADMLTVYPEITEKRVYEMVERNVRQHPRVYGSCVAFEPYAFDESRRLFGPYAWRSRPNEIGKMDVAVDAYNYLDWQWYDDPKKKKASIWTEPFFDEGAGNVVMVTHSAPFYRDGKFRGVATVDVHLEKLQQWARFRPDIAIFAILSREGKFLSHPEPKYIMDETIFSLAEKNNRPDIAEFGKLILEKGAGVAKVKNFPGEEDSFVVYAPVRSTGWVLMAAVSEKKIMAPVWRQLGMFTAFMLLSLIVLVVILSVVSFRITDPIRKLSWELKRVASGDLEVSTGTQYPRDEIGGLAGTLHWMVGQLKSHIQALTLETAARGALEGELRIAREIQASLLPRKFPPFPEHKDFDLHALNVPARHVAGDFFDYFFISKDELILAIGDVSGKGISAAMFMAVTRTHLRNLAETLKIPADILTRLNKELTRENEQGFFVTMTLAHYNIKTGQILYSIAGHPLPYVVGPAGLRAFGEVSGTVLGAFEEARYASGSGRLEPGEAIVFYTDGVTEGRSGESEFSGSERFEEIMTRGRTSEVRELCETVYSYVAGYQDNKLADDVTIMALRRNF